MFVPEVPHQAIDPLPPLLVLLIYLFLSFSLSSFSLCSFHPSTLLSHFLAPPLICFFLVLLLLLLSGLPRPPDCPYKIEYCNYGRYCNSPENRFSTILSQYYHVMEHI